MIGINFIFHVVSAIAFAAMIYWLLQMSRNQRFLLSLLQVGRGQQSRLLLDWPQGFLKKFCRALAIPLTIDGRFVAAPLKIDPGSWVRLFLSHGINSIHCRQDAVGQMIVCLSLSEQPVGETGMLAKQLSDGLGGQTVKIEG